MQYIGFIIYLVLFFLVIIISIKKYITAKDFIEKIIYVLFPIIYIVFGIVYALDLYNIPSNLGWDKNVSIERWFNYISSYSSSIVGAFIGGVFVFLVTKKQIDEQKKQYKVDKRIENAPVLQYRIINTTNDFFKDNPDKVYRVADIEERFVNYGGNEEHLYHLFICVENIGLNHARDLSVHISDTSNKIKGDFKKDTEQSILKKDDFYWFDFIFCYPFSMNGEINTIKITVSYKDFLNNLYKQDIKVDAIPTSISGSEYKGYFLEINNKTIKNEKVVGGK